MRNRGILFVLCLLLALSVSACAAMGSREDALPDGAFRLYVLNHDHTEVLPEAYALQADLSDPLSVVEETVHALQSAPADKEHVSPFSEDVVLHEYRLEDGLLTLDFDVRYLDPDPATEALTRAAIVLTLTQIEGVDGVLFLVSGTALMKNDTEPVGVMYADSFVTLF